MVSQVQELRRTGTGVAKYQTCEPPIVGESFVFHDVHDYVLVLVPLIWASHLRKENSPPPSE